MRRRVKFPEIRERVIAAIDLLAQPYETDRSWLNDLPSGTSHFGVIFDLFYEELDLPSRSVPFGAIGYYLESQEEALALYELASLVLRVVEETEEYANNDAYPTDEEYRRAPTWPQVVDSARDARRVIGAASH